MKKLDSEKLKKFANRKILLGISSLVICVALIAVCSFVPFIIDPTQWMTMEFLTNELIIVAIAIFSMVATMFIGQASNAQNENSNLAKARASFFVSVTKITNINAFNQWIKKVMQPRDMQTINERTMREVGIEDFSVVKLEFSEIRALLETPQKYGDRYYKGLSKQQIKVLIDIKNGKYKTKLVEPEYYLSVKNLIDPKTITERSSKEGIKKSLYLARSIIGRVIIIIVTAMIFASLMRDLSADAGDIASALQSFISRLWALISSAFLGYMVGTQINDIDAEYINMRVTVHTMFLQDKDFKPLNQQEEAKEQFKERVRQENIAVLENNSSLLGYNQH